MINIVCMSVLFYRWEKVERNKKTIWRREKKGKKLEDGSRRFFSLKTNIN